MKRWVIVCILMSVSVCFSDTTPATNKASDAKKAYETAIKNASASFYKSKIAADKQAIEELKIAAHIARQDELSDIQSQLSSAEANLKTDQDCLSGRVTIQVDQNLWGTDKSTAIVSNVDQILTVGMSKSDCDSKEKSRGWNQTLIEQRVAGEVVEYSLLLPSGFLDKDLCLFEDGKLTKYRPTRLEDEMKRMPPGTAEQVSGETFFGH